MKTEEWRPIEGWEGYEVSDIGNVRSFKNRSGTITKTPHNLSHNTLRGGGYYYVELNNGSKKIRKYFIHRLVAMAFIPNVNNKPHINHITGIKTDNRVENLEWVTPLENTRHCYANGLKTDFQRKPIVQYTLNGCFVKEYPSLTNAGEVTGIKISNMSKVANNKRPEAGGFKWKYA